MYVVSFTYTVAQKKFNYPAVAKRINMHMRKQVVLNKLGVAKCRGGDTPPFLKQISQICQMFAYKT